MRAKSLAFFMLCLTASAGWSQNLLMEGHKALARDRYDDAISLYEQALEQGARFQSLDEIIEVLKIRRDLGNIEPKYVQKICAIYVTEINVIDENGRTHRSRDITSAQRQELELYQQLTKRIIEGFTRGEFSISWDWVDAISTYREGQELNPYNPDVLNLERFFFDHIDDYDTFITFSNEVSPSTGLARAYPYVNGVVYGPSRGMCSVSPGSFSTLFHEYFHTIEWVSGGIGAPAHAWRENPEKYVPDWKGETEFDYYRWQFENTLRDIGWSKLIHRRRWQPLASRSVDLWERVVSAYKDIPLEDRQEAVRLLEQGGESQDEEKAIALYEQGIDLSPYHPELLERLIRYYRVKDPLSPKLDSLLDRYTAVQSIGMYASLPSEGSYIGEFLGAWNPAVVAQRERVLEWKADEFSSVPGDYLFTFQYSYGGKAVAISWAALYEDGVEVSRDEHEGWSGTKKEHNVYRLTMPRRKPGASYTVRARLRADGGDRSYGIVFIKPAEQPIRAVNQTYELSGAAYYQPAIIQGGDAVIGAWTPSTVREEGSIYEWSVAVFLDGNGTYVATFFYTKGWKAVEIEWAALLKNGVEISRDTHHGFSGSKKERIEYYLRIAEYDPQAEYTVRAFIKGANGTDSNGEVFFRKE